LCVCCLARSMSLGSVWVKGQERGEGGGGGVGMISKIRTMEKKEGGWGERDVTH